jgi:Tol biopolymer transport system component
VWWPDGKSIVYACGAGQSHICRKAADGTGTVEKVLDAADENDIPFSISPDARYLVFMRIDSKGNKNWDIFGLPLFGDRKPFPIVATDFVDASPVVSPNGKWMVYQNNESGHMELYLQPFPTGAGRWQVSTAGGVRPRWRGDGRELFFQSLDGELMAMDMKEAAGAPQLGTPHALFKVNTVVPPSGPFALAPDGSKILVNATTTQQSTEPLVIVTDWTADLGR